MFDRLIDILRAAWSNLMPLAIVPETHFALRLRFGRYVGDLSSGPHGKWPFADQILTCDRRVHFYQTGPQSLRTVDGVQVTVKAVMSFRAAEPRLAILSQEKFGSSVWDGTAAALAVGVCAASYEDLFTAAFSDWLMARCRADNAPFGIELLTCRLQEIARSRTYRVMMRD